MRRYFHIFYTTLALSVWSPFVLASDSTSLGQEITFDQKKGNCLACHKIEGGISPGNIGPELNNMKQRYPDRALLRDRVWDETKYNPYTVMPPFGKHQILSEEEIDLVVDFLYTL